MLLRKTMLFSSIIAVLAGSSTARAQSAEADAKDQQTLDAVMVTATKRATPLQQTPIAITAIGSETLEKERVMTVQDITSLVPGFLGDHPGRPWRDHADLARHRQ